ncbi:hypothetical protein SAMN05216266_108144 [Amycolatopsis marina]|uniref:34 kDa antigenic protein n=1 Tax=Amycolatopsis marina TaxID=490629 RepID=A0A1I1A713_9PSEU|nr:DUF5336 domain-containing protein [Amycolatopsis marina]SFB32358.1 hypothetical protein SAMN05216266_108144 [Amycolatopsis marina]
MTYPSGGPGYPQQGGPQQQPQTPNQNLSVGSLAVILALAVTVLGLINYFIGFSEDARGATGVIQFLLVGGLLAALRVLPNGPKVLPFAALFSVLGAFMALLTVVHSSDVPGVITVVLILGILQMLVAIAALLFDYNVLKMPAAKPQAGPYGQQYGQPGQFGGQGQFGQSGPQDPPSGGFNQPTQYGPPATPPPGQQQATQYAPQQGQFFQQQSPESGQQQGGPGQQQSGPGQQS